jgi:branched-chain amino acid transport system permease protein
MVLEILQMLAVPASALYDRILIDFAFLKDMAFGLAICAFLIYEPRGLSYRWWQAKNYFNLWPFSY